jgi:PD-(D/E)XK nuclease superfamily
MSILSGEPSGALAPIRKRLSYSSLSLFMSCSHQWEAKYVGLDGVKLKEPPNVWMARGTAVHAAMEFHLRAKMRAAGKWPDFDPETLELAPAIRAASISWDEEKSSPDFNWKGRTDAGIWTEIEAMVTAGHEHLCPTLIPTSVEWELECPIPGTDWSFLARVDAATADAKGEGQWLYDWKTGKPWTQAQADSSDQMTAYGWAFNEVWGEYPKGFSILAISPPEGKVSQAKEVITKRVPEQYKHFERVLHGVIKQIEVRAFWPNQHYEWCRNCPLTSSCRPWVS